VRTHVVYIFGYSTCASNRGRYSSTPTY